MFRFANHNDGVSDLRQDVRGRRLLSHLHLDGRSLPDGRSLHCSEHRLMDRQNRSDPCSSHRELGESLPLFKGNSCPKNVFLLSGVAHSGKYVRV